MTALTVPTKTNSYSYTGYDINDMNGWKDVGGNYLFARKEPNGSWTILYAGITDSFKNRIPNHERLAEAKKLGATSIFAHANAVESARKAEEADIIGHYKPKMNTQLK